MKKILWLFLVLLVFAALFVFVYINPFPAMMEVFSPMFGGGNVTLGGTKYPASSKNITAVISRWDMEELDRFTQLESLDLRGSSCYQEIAAWSDAHPDVAVNLIIPLANVSIFVSQAEELDLSWVDAEHLSETLGVLRYAKGLRALRLGEVGGSRLTLQDLMRIHELFPDLRLEFTAVIGGQTVDSSSTSIDLSALGHEDARAAAMVLGQMDSLKTVELGSQGSSQLTWEDIALLKASIPDARFSYRFTLYGRELDLDAEKLDFRGVKVDDEGAALYPVLSCMNRCTYLDMDSTGVSDEALSAIRDLFPKTRVVWRVWFGENYSVRTDVEKILASKPSVGGMITDTKPLTYCTNIKYLDLGHNEEMTDIDFAMYMPRLEVLIIAMTGVSDLSPLKNCMNLEYLELNSTPGIHDLSPLEGHTALRHLNIACCPLLSDISPLYGITKLERLWIGNETPVPQAQVAKMREAAPGCTIDTTTSDPHGNAWRFSAYDPEIPKYYWVPRHELLREQMGYNYQEYSFYWLDPLCGLEAPAEYKGKFGKEVYGLE
ncbi:MAG: leucine-rich repeat domain-containing protein [Eubacteriales bacterium]|nr:leucine-rich repeat domain-containing protein [Eubacteriales bacterium]